MQETPLELISEAEYLDRERASEMKHEYFRGEVFAMTGASESHNLIVANVVRELGNQLKKTSCRVYPSDMRLKIEQSGLYTYPDVMVVCGDREYGDNRQDTLLNPELIVEVLSNSPEAYDRGRKFAMYRTLDSLKAYLMISQNRQKMELYVRKEDGGWIFTESGEEHPQIVLTSFQCVLSHEEVYDKVEMRTEQQQVNRELQ